MVDLQRERADVAKADADIAEREARLARQEQIVAELDRDGHDTADATKLLAVLRQTLEAWRSLRAQIVGMIEQAERRQKRRRRST